MKAPVFLSHAAEDRAIAIAVCDSLEQSGIRCWMAPRDIRPGTSWDEAIIDAIDGCRVVVLIFSAHANASAHIAKEVRNAIEAGKTVVPFRIEALAPADFSKALRYQLAAAQWFDALPPPAEQHIGRLIEALHEIRGDLADRTTPAESPLRSASVSVGTHASALSDAEAAWRRLPPYLQLAVAGVALLSLAFAFVMLPRSTRELLTDMFVKVLKVVF